MARTRGASPSWAMACFRKPTFLATASTRVTRQVVAGDGEREAREAGAGPCVEQRQGSGVEGPEDGQGVENVLVRHLDRIEDGGEVDAGAPPTELTRQPRQRVRLGLGQRGSPSARLPSSSIPEIAGFSTGTAKPTVSKPLKALGEAAGTLFSPGLPQRGPRRPQRGAAGRGGAGGRSTTCLLRREGPASPPERRLLCHDSPRNTRALVAMDDIALRPLAGRCQRAVRVPVATWRRLAMPAQATDCRGRRRVTRRTCPRGVEPSVSAVVPTTARGGPPYEVSTVPRKARASPRGGAALEAVPRGTPRRQAERPAGPEVALSSQPCYARIQSH